MLAIFGVGVTTSVDVAVDFAAVVNIVVIGSAVDCIVESVVDFSDRVVGLVVFAADIVAVVIKDETISQLPFRHH